MFGIGEQAERCTGAAIPSMVFIHPQILQITQIKERNLLNLRNLWIIFFVSGIAGNGGVFSQCGVSYWAWNLLRKTNLLMKFYITFKQTRINELRVCRILF